jgi:hypothetical protein
MIASSESMINYYFDYYAQCFQAYQVPFDAKLNYFQQCHHVSSKTIDIDLKADTEEYKRDGCTNG